MQWFTISKISDNLETTPEGFVLARGVPVARCGVQLYRDVELPDLVANADGWIACDRDPQEVFRAESIASFTGKPITNDHPYDVVGPHNWSDLAIGVVQHPRRGTGDKHDLLVADLLFTTAKGIELVRNGKRALSVGYDAHYDQHIPGRAAQKNIQVNHVALVDEGRCGARCTIVDGIPNYNIDAEVDDELRPSDTEDVIAMLGFDPLEFSEGDDDADMAEAKAIAREAEAKAKEATADAKAHRSFRQRFMSIWLGPQRVVRFRLRDDFIESEHPRGQPENAGQFVKGGGSKATKPAEAKGKASKAESSAAHDPNSLKAHLYNVLSELDNRNAPDEDYKKAFSTGTKTGLKAGETWRGKLAEWIQELDEPAEPKKKGHASLKDDPEDVIKRIPQARSINAAQRRIQAMAEHGLRGAVDPKEYAKEIIEYVSKFKSQDIQDYANRLINALAREHNLPKGSLGIAKHAPRSEPGEPPVKPPPGPAKVEPKYEPPPPKPKPAPPSGVKPKTLGGALSTKTGMPIEEARFHSKAWQHATPELLAALQNTKSLTSIDKHPNPNGAHYQSWDHVISMGNDDPIIWRHEYGHAIDWQPSQSGKKPRSFRADSDRAYEATVLVKKVNAMPDNYFKKPNAVELQVRATKLGIDYGDALEAASYDQRGAQAVIEVLEGNMVNVAGGANIGGVGMGRAMYHDFLGAMTHNKVGGGHTNDYYTNASDKKCSEMFANYVCLTNGRLGHIYKRMLHNIAPKCCAHFDTILEEVGNGVDLLGYKQ